MKEDGSCWYYEYDALNRLVQASGTRCGSGSAEPIASCPGTDAQEASLYAYEYEYDRVGNRLWIVENDVPTYYTYDAANELLTEHTPWSAAAPGCVAAYQYDGHGNTIARAVDGGDTVYYDYDARANRKAADRRSAAFCGGGWRGMPRRVNA